MTAHIKTDFLLTLYSVSKIRRSNCPAPSFEMTTKLEYNINYSLLNKKKNQDKKRRNDSNEKANQDHLYIPQ